MISLGIFVRVWCYIGGSWRISERRDKEQVSKSWLHGMVAAQDLLHLPNVVHLSCTGDRHLLLLLQRGPGRLAAGQGGIDEEGHRTEKDH